MQRALLLLLIASSYLLFAGSPRWTLLPLLALAGVTVMAAPRRTLSFPRHARGLDLGLIGIVFAIALQIAPLPRAVVAVLSPHADDLRATVRFDAPPGWWARLSINPGATEEALAVVLLGVFSFWIARGVFAFGRTRQFCRVLALLGAAAAVSAVILRGAAPGLVLGILRPETPSANPFGAFVNRNHFAGWLLLVAGPVFGYLIAHLRTHPAYRQRFRSAMKQFLVSGAMVTAMAALAVFGVMLLTLSRSAVAGIGSAAIYGWSVGRERLRIERTHLPVVLACIGISLLAGVLFVDISAWTTRFNESLETTGDRNRLTIWRESLPVLRDFWLSGTGAGTYSDAMMKYQQTRVWIGSMSRWAHFNNAHSHYLQVAAEGGLLLLIPVAVTLAQLVRLGRRAIANDKGEMQWARIGAGGGLIGIAVQSIWETSLILPANAILCGTVAGLLMFQRQRGGSDDTPSTGHLATRKIGR